MKIDMGARVRSRDGENLGTIRHLIVDPETHDVRAVVIEKGFLLTEDIEAPPDRIRMEAPGRAVLDMTGLEARALPRFQPSAYQTPTDELAARLGHPAATLLWPTGPAMAPTMQAPAAHVPGEVGAALVEVERSDLEAPPRPPVITRGMNVISRDGKKIGEVDSVSFDSETGHPLSLLVRQGWLFSHDIALPGDLIARVDGDSVHLNVDEGGISGYLSETSLLMS